MHLEKIVIIEPDEIRIHSDGIGYTITNSLTRDELILADIVLLMGEDGRIKLLRSRDTFIKEKNPEREENIIELIRHYERKYGKREFLEDDDITDRFELIDFDER